MDPELLAQFPIAEAAIEALGLVLWPMVEFEADDAIAAAADRFAADPRVERILICTPDKDMAQCVRGERVVLWDRRRDLVYDDAGRPREVGRAALERPGPPGPRRRRGRRLPGAPRLGRQVRIGRPGPLRDARGDPRPRRRLGRARACAAPRALAATLRERMDEALLYRDLARLRTTADGVPIPEADVDELRWRGADRERWAAFCDEWGLGRLVGPPASLGERGLRRP